MSDEDDYHIRLSPRGKILDGGWCFSSLGPLWSQGKRCWTVECKELLVDDNKMLFFTFVDAVMEVKKEEREIFVVRRWL
jgi:hypothetical protein